MEASGSIGAGRIHYDCYYIQESYYCDGILPMVVRYNKLVEDAIDFIIYSDSIVNSDEHHYDREANILDL